MTKQQFDKMTLDEAIDWATDELLDDLTTEEWLLAFVKEKIDDDNLMMACHILNSIYNSAESYNGYYIYDYSMGTLQTPRPITCKEDLEDLIDFDDEDSSADIDTDCYRCSTTNRLF